MISNSFVICAQEITARNALASYINNGDTTFDWQVRKIVSDDGVKLYSLIFTSQTWQEFKWRHELTVIVPDEFKHDKALLFISGGDNDSHGEPEFQSDDDPFVRTLVLIARESSSIVAVLNQIPNQPLYGGKTEDAISVTTLTEFLKRQDFSLPIWFPMTKAAMRSLDVIDGFVDREYGIAMTGYVVSGGSKRGWTTWLTAAMDRRVVGAVPMVIDIVNIPLSIDYQKSLFGDYSPAIAEYTLSGLSDMFVRAEGADIVTMIDPYSYRQQLQMPKMIIYATNDPFWTVDGVKNYIDDIPGQNHISYASNVGHGLGDKIDAMNALSAFYYNILNGSKMPDVECSIENLEQGVRLSVCASTDRLRRAMLYSAESPECNFVKSRFVAQKVDIGDLSRFTVDVPFPSNGYCAFYLALEYENPLTSGTYNVCTRMYLCSTDTLFDKRHCINN